VLVIPNTQWEGKGAKQDYNIPHGINIVASILKNNCNYSAKNAKSSKKKLDKVFL